MAKLNKKIYVFLFDGTFIEECVGYRATQEKYNIKGDANTLAIYIRRKSIVYGKYFFNVEKVFNPKVNKTTINCNPSLSKKSYSYNINKDGEIYKNYVGSKIKESLDEFYFED